jgi:enterobactin synthetase component D
MSDPQAQAFDHHPGEGAPGRELFELPVGYACVAFSAGDQARFAAEPLPAQLERAVPKRRVEFLAGRHCARAALRQLAPELAEAPLAIGPHRAPVWPPGVHGAITHTHGFAAAAVVRAEVAVGVGLDAEQLLTPPRAEGLAGMLANPGELAALQASGLDPSTLLTLVFSAKESLFKCLWPRVGRYFDFLDATVVRVEPSRHAFTIALETEVGGLPRGARLEGRFGLAGGLLHTGLALSVDALAGLAGPR